MSVNVISFKSPLWVVVLFGVGQLLIVLFWANGPYIDEAIYLGVGSRVLAGQMLADNYLLWLNGCPCGWPVLAALGYQLAGLMGARLVAVFFSMLTLGAFAAAVEKIFNTQIAFWSTLALSLNGLFIFLGHLAVYDLPALAALSVSFWCLANFVQNEKERWLVSMALAFAVSVVMKYGYALMLIALLALIVALRPKHSSLRPLAIFLGVAAACLLPYFLFITGGLILDSLNVYTNHPQFFTRAEIVTQNLYFGLAPGLFALGGIWLAKKIDRLAAAGAMWLALLLWPVFHIVLGSHVSMEKHVVMGFIFAYPLVGLALDYLWREQSRLLVAVMLSVLGAWGGLQWYRQEYSWPDVRPVAQYLVQHVQRGEKVFVDYSGWVNVSWWYVPYLYPQQIASPFELFDRDRPEFAQLGSCQTPWWVVRDDDYDVLAGNLKHVVTQCGYERMFTSTSQNYFVTGVGGVSTYSPTLIVYRLRP